MSKFDKKEYSVKEYAAYKECSIPYVYKAIHKGLVDYKMIGKTYIILE